MDANSNQTYVSAEARLNELKLELPAAVEDHRRVLAVLQFLGS